MVKFILSHLGRRPTESLSGAGGAAAVYGYLTQTGVSPQFAAPAAVVVAVLPSAISEAVDIYRTLTTAPPVPTASDIRLSDEAKKAIGR